MSDVDTEVPDAPASKRLNVKSSEYDYDEEANRRLLLYEVLLDEYETLDQPELFERGDGELREDYEKESGKIDDQGRAAKWVEHRLTLHRVLRARYADPVSAGYCSAKLSEAVSADLERIREYVRRYDSELPGRSKSGSEEYEGESEREAKKLWLEGRVDEELVGEFFRLVYAAQKREAQKPGAMPAETSADGNNPGGGSPSGVTPGGVGEEGGGGDSAGGNGAGGGDKRTREQIRAQAMRSALCLSGGGIRSATFNLGVLQALARHGLLKNFDYLSTVSGGGFVGGWLTAWIHRHPGGVGEVMEELGRAPASTLKPDPQPVEHLRVYSNFLSPQPGLLSADTWTLIASLLRNLLITWLVFLPVIAALLMLPRMWLTIVQRSPHYDPHNLTLGLLAAFLCGVWAFSYTGIGLPTTDRRPASRPPFGWPRRFLSRAFEGFGLLDGWAAWRRWREKRGGEARYLVFCLLPLVVAASAASVYCWGRLIQRKAELLPWDFVYFTAAIVLIPWVVSAAKIYARARPAGWKSDVGLVAKLAGATAAMFFAVYVSGYVLWYAASLFMPVKDQRGSVTLYATLAPPVFLLLMALGGTLIAGFTSRFTEDADQEWWARAGAWILITGLLWITAHLLVLHGPVMLLGVGSFIQRSWTHGVELKPGDLFNLLGTAAGVISGVITLLGGFSAGTPANEKEAKRVGPGRKLLKALTGLLAPIFLAFIIILLALGSNWLLKLLAYVCGKLSILGAADATLPAASAHADLLRQTPFRFLLVAALLILLASVALGRLINTNSFSLHYMWRNRIIRAYLGASRRRRRPNRFTGFDPDDNIQMHQLRPQETTRLGPPEPFKNVREAEERCGDKSGKLLHIINIALNLTGGDKLAWQDRKSESFTVSPLHAGSYWLGYRRTWKYGGYGAREGISLGTAVAISGAFVSPNMGYMMTSPVVRFLMTLFNVRFGWWLGNPGRAGDRPYKLEWPLLAIESLFVGKKPDFNMSSPRLSVLPIVEEAFGHINDRSNYVYLSDGGHFENLGLYEMVLRRCRFIVVCDASTDAEYSFDSLAMSVRQIRVDLGVPIDLPELSITTPSRNFRNKYCAVGRIRYSCVDRDPHNPEASDEDYDGVLVYIKPAIIGGEPRDVANYGQGNASFPQEVIVDQWFSEAQFESYRALASHIVHTICGGDSNPVTFPELERKAAEHTRLNFQAYEEQVQYAAFEHLFKGSMGTVSPSSFAERAKSYMKDLLK